METVAAAAEHPYRSKAAACSPKVGIRTRALAARGVSIVLFCVVCRWLALFVSPIAVVAVELLLVAGTWLFTLRCEADSPATRGLAWGLRLLATLDSGLAIAITLGTTSWTQIGPLRELLSLVSAPAVALLFLAARLHSYGLPQLARRILTVIALCSASALFAVIGSALSAYLAILLVVTCFVFYLCGWLWGFALMLRMRNILLVRGQEWWLDVEALPRVEWTSYARLGDGRVEIAGPRGGACWFDGYADAMFWLHKNGLCSQDQALAQGLVARAPMGALAPQR
ncbi:MAG TPA: hypothetical protein VI197_28035 [Polyangiaceae bacterium]